MVVVLRQDAHQVEVVVVEETVVDRLDAHRVVVVVRQDGTSPPVGPPFFEGHVPPRRAIA